MITLGAIDKLTKEYIYPKIANKTDSYICFECNKDIILKQGDIRIHHFAHKINHNCNYYDKPSETQIHKDAKMLLKKILESNEIKFIRKCNNNCCIKKYKIPLFTNDSKILLEYKFKFNDCNKIADVAYINNDKIICLFEICHTNKTKENNRPEPWFEIDAIDFINQINNTNNNKIKINCIRKIINCKNNKISEKEYVSDISKIRKIYGNEKYIIYCTGCGSDSYNPIRYNDNEYALCNDCLINNDKYKYINKQINKRIIYIPTLKYKLQEVLRCIICRKYKYNPYCINNKFYAICKYCFNQYKDNYNFIL